MALFALVMIATEYGVSLSEAEKLDAFAVGELDLKLAFGPLACRLVWRGLILNVSHKNTICLRIEDAGNLLLFLFHRLDGEVPVELLHLYEEEEDGAVEEEHDDHSDVEAEHFRVTHVIS